MAIDPVTPALDALNRQRMRSRTWRNFWQRLHRAAAVGLLLALVLMINYLSARHYARFDWSRNRFYELSGKTRVLLETLTAPLHVTVFIQPGHEIYHHMYDDIIRLLREYEYLSGNRVIVERVDPDRHLGRAEAVMARFALDRVNVVVFAYGDRFRVVSADDVMDMDYRPLLDNAPPRKTAFMGEQVFSSAIFSLVEADPLRVYYLQGHGERDFEDRDEYVGLSRIGQTIRRDHIELASFSFLQRNAIPDDAQAIIIASPSRAYSEQEIDRIAHYVNRSGRLILMLNAETDAGFTRLLRQWGIKSIDNLLVDPSRSLSGFDLLTSSYADHPITERLHDITTVFYWPRALPLLMDEREDLVSADKPKATALAMSSPNSWAELDLNHRPHRFDPERDLKGPLPVAVAVERGPSGSLSVSIQPNRVVVFGDVDFISNSGISGGNADLFMNALNWILERDRLLDIAPRPVEQIRLLIDRRQLTHLFWFVVVGVPAAVSAVGLMVRWRRRR